MQIKWLLFICLFLLIGCGDTEPNSIGNHQNQHQNKIQVLKLQGGVNVKALKQSAENVLDYIGGSLRNPYKAICSQTECPENLALSISFDEDDYERHTPCTAFLIDEKTAIMNYHCLPKGANRAGDLCEDQLFFSFPTVGNKKAFQVVCKQILETGFKNYMYDYALVELDTQNNNLELRDIPRLHHKGVPHDLSVRLWSMTPVGDYQGVASSVVCSTNRKGLFTESYKSDYSSQIHYSGCQTLPGNSGAMITDAISGAIIGNHSKASDGSSKIMSILHQTGNNIMSDQILPRSSGGRLGAGTNFACFCYDEKGGLTRQCQDHIYVRLECHQTVTTKKIQAARTKKLTKALLQNITPHALNTIPAPSFAAKGLRYASKVSLDYVKNSKGQIIDIEMRTHHIPICIEDRQLLLDNAEPIYEFPSTQYENEYKLFVGTDYSYICPLRYKLDKDYTAMDMELFYDQAERRLPEVDRSPHCTKVSRDTSFKIYAGWKGVIYTSVYVDKNDETAARQLAVYGDGIFNQHLLVCASYSIQRVSSKTVLAPVVDLLLQQVEQMRNIVPK